MSSDEYPGIGELNEKPLHAALKAWYAQPDDGVEVAVDGYVIDLVRDGLLVEIQTANFSRIKRKLVDLVARHRVRLVYPITREKWLLKLPREGWDGPRRRKSPKRGYVEELFGELVSFPALLREANFSLEVLFIQEEEARRHTGKSWRHRGWETVERRLLEVVERRRFEAPRDLGLLLPEALPPQFTTRDLAEALGRSRWLAQRMAYCLREMGQIVQVGKRGRAYLYVRV